MAAMVKPKNLLTDWWYNTDALQAESDRADAERARLDAGTYARIEANRGTAAAEEWRQRRNQNENTGAVNASAYVDEGFDEGWNEGRDNITGASRGLLNWTGGFVWDLLPGWLWFALIVGGVGYVAWQFGWLQKFLKAPR